MLSISTFIFVCLACFVFLAVGVWIGSLLSKGALIATENRLRTEFDVEKQQQQQDGQSLRQELALVKQENQQLNSAMLSDKQNNQETRLQLEDLRTLYAEVSTKLSASVSNESGLNTRLSERNFQIETLNQQLQTLNQAQAGYQELIESQKVQLGKAQAEKEQLTQLQLSVNNKDKVIHELQTELSANLSKIQELKTASLKDAESMTEKLSLLENNKLQLKQEFENLAHQIFENKQQHFSQQSQQGLNTLLNPFKEQLESFRKRVDEVHTNTVEGQTHMKAEFEKLRELNVRINDEAANLTKALKGDKKLQGTWGEQKVDLLLQRAGLRKDFEYKKEQNFKNDDGKNQRPDFVVQLPEGKHIIIDSKMSLVAYTQYVAAETDQERKIALNAHIKALKDHITELGQRKYHTLNGLDSPDFVFLFMGVEPAYILAAEHAPSLFEEAYEKNIAIVTATNLLPVLRVVANLWVIQRQNQTTKELADQASRVYDKLRIFVEKMEDLGKHIDKAQVSYRESFNTLKDGQGSLTKTVSKFVDLGVKVSKQLPPSVLLEDLDSQPSLSINVKE